MAFLSGHYDVSPDLLTFKMGDGKMSAPKPTFNKPTYGW
jgi:hypothetical protein